MKRPENIDTIIISFLTGSMTKEERQKLDKWIILSHENKVLLGHLEKIWKERSVDPKLIKAEEMAERIWFKAIVQE